MLRNLLCECPVHELTAGLGNGQEFEQKRELKALLQPSRNWPYHQAGAYAHQKANLRICKGGVYILLGRNGVGKSTLLRAIAHRDNGLQEFPQGVSTFLLDQELHFLRDSLQETVMETVMKHANWKLRSLQEEASRLENDDVVELTEEEMCQRLCDIYEELEESERQALERKQQAMLLLKGLGFKKGKEHTKVAELSGGWQARVGLVCALIHRPNLLLLDEPTNHLDINAICWLEKYLKLKYQGSVLCITHDREFAQEVGTDVIVFADQKLEYFNNMSIQQYEKAVMDKEVKMRHLMSNLEKQKDNLRKQKMALSKAAAQGNESAGRQAAKLAKKLGRTGLEKTADGRKWNVQRDGVRVGADNNNCGGWKNGKMTALTVQKAHQSHCEFGFSSVCKSPNLREEKVFELWNPRYRYPGTKKDFSFGEFPIASTSRLAIVGKNGAGKSTLLKLLTGHIEPTAGEIRRDHGIRVFALSQRVESDLAQDPRPPLKALLDAKPGQRDHDVRSLLGRFGICGDQALRPMKDLSGGQRVRVAMALGALNDPHILLLDEPTNHLDMESVDALAEAIETFDGGVIIATHDRALIRRAAKEILLVEDGRASLFQGTPAEYLQMLT